MATALVSGGKDPPDRGGGLSLTISQISNKESSENQKIKPTAEYSEKDNGPFIVYIETSKKSNNTIGKFSHLKLAREIFDLNLSDVKGVKNKGLNRVAVEFVSFRAANQFLQNKKLKDKGYEVFVPFNFVTCKAIVREVDMDLSEDDLKNYFTAPVEIISIKRMNRKTFKNDKPEYVPTGTCLFTFRGTIIPKEVYYCGMGMRVSIYVPPVTQCFSCLLYGHTKKNCKSKPKCFNCAGNEHEEQDENGLVKNFSCESKCHFCKGNHRSNNKKCPEYERQLNIKKLMAFENLTYHDANNMCKKTYEVRNEYYYNPTEFPAIKKPQSHQNSNANETITPTQRRTEYFKTMGSKRSYQQVAMNEPTKKRIIQKGYDRQQHNDCLYFPNSRPLSSQNCQQPSTSLQQHTINVPQLLQRTRNSEEPKGATNIDYQTKITKSGKASDTDALLNKYINNKEGRDLIAELILSYLNSQQISSEDDDMF